MGGGWDGMRAFYSQFDDREKNDTSHHDMQCQWAWLFMQLSKPHCICKARIAVLHNFPLVHSIYAQRHWWITRPFPILKVIHTSIGCILATFHWPSHFQFFMTLQCENMYGGLAIILTWQFSQCMWQQTSGSHYMWKWALGNCIFVGN